MIKFEKVSRFKDIDINLPIRKTKNSAGYDFEVAEDILIEPMNSLMSRASAVKELNEIAGALQRDAAVDLNMAKEIFSLAKAKPTLVSTGVKCYLDPDTYLELSVRSSTPLKYWLVLANGVGIIDADYADNPDNEGEIFFQLINLSNLPIYLRKGDIIGQGIIKKFEITDDDAASGDRVGGLGSTTKGE